jgi:FkbM family methyltransferase
VTVLDKRLRDGRLRLVDVGARGGIAPRWQRFAGLIEVTAFEPEPAECERLNREAAALPYPIRHLPVALGGERSDSVPFYVTAWPVASSVRRPNAGFLRSFPTAQSLLDVRRVEEVSVTTLDEVAEREGLTADCLKVDVEGAALEVLAGAEASLRGTLVLEVEADVNPLFEGEALFPAVDSHMRERGWALQGLRRTSWRRGEPLEPAASGLGGQIVSVDALYANERLIGGGLSLARELKLLVILAAYLQMDAVHDRLARSPALTEGLAPAEREELQRVLAPPDSGALWRLARRAFARLGPARRRALADRMQRGDASAWEDPHFF